MTIGPAGTTASNGGKIIFDGAANISTTAPIRSVQADGATSLINGMTRPTITATGLIGDPSAAVYAVNGGQIDVGQWVRGYGYGHQCKHSDSRRRRLVRRRHSWFPDYYERRPCGQQQQRGCPDAAWRIGQARRHYDPEAVGPQAAGLKIDGTMVPFGTMDGLTVNMVGDPTRPTMRWAYGRRTRFQA